MSEKAIKVENLSKRFTISHQEGGYTALRDVITNNVNDAAKRVVKLIKGNGVEKKSESEEFWALRHINFSISQGDRVGIIGRNGAGKSTLLKILSRITEPSEGRITIRGRVASLLEVGTGFHPELTGRENIFLNGAILGMTRAEIRRKFDEIVDFSEVERFLDTPVKRYSSGMYVRLAFAVAAHLEPEILVIDEVLAVGDAQFQKKCLGKMEDISRGKGRTVLFVSHNMQAVKQLCNKGILLDKGHVLKVGDVNEVAESYLSAGINSSRETIWNDTDGPGNEKITILRVAAFPRGKTSADHISTKDEIVVEIQFLNKVHKGDIDITWDIFDMDSVHVCHIGTVIADNGYIDSGVYQVRFHIPPNLLNAKRYYLNVLFGENQRYVIFRFENILSIDVEDSIERKGASFHQLPGAIHPKLIWEKAKLK